MTVATENARDDYIGTGSAGPFPYTFRIFASTDLVVTRTNTDASETTLTLGTEYTVTGVGSYNGGNVTLTLALETGETLTIRRVLELTQGTDLPNLGEYAPEVVEQALDRQMMVSQQLAEQSERAMRSAVGVNVDNELPPPEAGKLLGWNDAEDGLENVAIADLVSAEALGSWIPDVFTGDGVLTAWSLTRVPGGLGNLDVSINGLTKIPGTDYTLSGQVVTFATPPANLSTILIRYGYATAQVATGFVPELQVATALQTVFLLTSAYTPGGGSMAVYLNGLRLAPGVDYVETDSTTVTLTTAAQLGDELLFVSGSELNNNVVATVNIADSAVTTAKVAASAITTAKIADTNVTTAKLANLSVTLAKLAIATGAISITASVTATLNALHYISGTSADYNIPIPTPVGNTGALLWFQVGHYATASKQFSLVPAAGLIDGQASLVLLHTNSILLVSNGTNWVSITKSLTTPWVDGGATTWTGTTSNPTKGTPTRDKSWWRRVGDSEEVAVEYAHSGGSPAAGSGDMLLTVPIGAIDTAKCLADAGAPTVVPGSSLGFALLGTVADGGAFLTVEAYNTTKVRFAGLTFSGANASGDTWSSTMTGRTFAETDLKVSTRFTVPMAGW